MCKTRFKKNYQGTETTASDESGWIENNIVTCKLDLDIQTKNGTTYSDTAVHRNPFYLSFSYQVPIISDHQALKISASFFSAMI